jgi:hypothetical protein
MKNEQPKWSKEELKIYILLLCAKADWKETPEEMTLIRSKSNQEIFDRIYKEISEDKEDKDFSLKEQYIDEILDNLIY